MRLRVRPGDPLAPTAEDRRWSAPKSRYARPQYPFPASARRAPEAVGLGITMAASRSVRSGRAGQRVGSRGVPHIFHVAAEGRPALLLLQAGGLVGDLPAPSIENHAGQRTTIYPVCPSACV